MPPELSQQLPTIALIGRVNVGKSSLFNRLTESRHAIVSREPGTTRDRTFGTCIWRGRQFRLIDTGGADVATIKNSIRLLENPRPQSTRNPLGAAILRQTQTAIGEADLLLVVVDGKSGPTPEDRTLARVVARLATAATPPKIVLVACNKLDRAADDARTEEFRALGLGQPWAVSAKNGRGTGDLLDAIAAALTTDIAPPPVGQIIRLGMFGRPNVGKSSLVNRLLGTERAVVSPEPLTTRESQETHFTHQGKNLVLVDTAGVKPWRKTSGEVATKAQQQSLRTLQELDVALLVVEAHLPISHQDQALADLIEASDAGSIIVANKWDLAAADGLPPPNVAAHYHTQLPPLSWAPVATISALTGQNVGKLLDLTVAIWERRQRIVPPEELAKFLTAAARRHPPRGLGRGHAGQPGAQRPRLYRMEQTGQNPPSFNLWIGHRQSLHETYRRFLLRLLVERFELAGANCKLYVKQLRPSHRGAR